MRLPLSRYLVILALLTAHVYGIACYAGQQSSNLEQSICGLKEPFVFWLWSSAAGEPSTARLTQVANIEDVAITSSDGRILVKDLTISDGITILDDPETMVVVATAPAAEEVEEAEEVDEFEEGAEPEVIGEEQEEEE